MIKFPQNFNDERVRRECEAGLVRLLHQNEKLRQELNIPHVGKDDKCRLQRFSVYNVTRHDHDRLTAFLDFDITGEISGHVIIGMATARITGLSDGWQDFGSELRGYAFSTYLKADIVTLKPSLRAKT